MILALTRLSSRYFKHKKLNISSIFSTLNACQPKDCWRLGVKLKNKEGVLRHEDPIKSHIYDCFIKLIFIYFLLQEEINDAKIRSYSWMIFAFPRIFSLYLHIGNHKCPLYAVCSCKMYKTAMMPLVVLFCIIMTILTF